MSDLPSVRVRQAFPWALNEMQTLLKSDEYNNTVLKALADEGINWNFNPPHAPH